ncbi:MAG: aminoacyl-tRNA hydrolase [Candidatus Jacksonbacteria bacterium]
MSNIICQEQKLIAGLGNPGKKYEKTRHNLGFMVIDELAKKLKIDPKSWAFNKKFNAEILKCSMFHVPCFMIKPQTFMNNSGQSIAKITNFYKIKTPNIWVIYDDIDLLLGTLRIRSNGSSGGHKGVQSIIDSLGSSDFARFRLGVGPVPDGFDPADFVLQKFAKTEIPIIKQMIEQTIEAINNSSTAVFTTVNP